MRGRTAPRLGLSQSRAGLAVTQGSPLIGEALSGAALPQSHSPAGRVFGGSRRLPTKRGPSWGRTPERQPGDWCRQATRPRSVAGVPLGAPATPAGMRIPLRQYHWYLSQAASPDAFSSCPRACGGSLQRDRPQNPPIQPGRRRPAAAGGGRTWSLLSFSAWRWLRCLHPPPPLRYPGAPHRPRALLLRVSGGRASAGPRFRGKKAFVLKTNHGPVTNAAKGTKKYLVLPVGEPSPVVVEEREIKRVKKLKKK